MEARAIRAAWLSALLVVFCGANYRSANFVVQTDDPRLAEQFAKAAEQWRRHLAVEWLGQEMPDWYQPCPMTVRVGANLGAGGATKFLFDRGEVYGWQMNIQGSAERIIDSVLPHEITHMVFASHFRVPLPRWADEGGATSVECEVEQAKHRKALQQFLRTGRGIAFQEMFAMTEYPPDVMPLYAQSHSLVDYLLQHGGRRRYVAYLAEAMQTHQWGAATQRWYGITDLGTLQNTWVAWVGQGCPRITPPTPAPESGAGEVLAANRRPRPDSNLVLHTAPSQSARPVELAENSAPTASPPAKSVMVPIETQLAHPQPFERPRQTILEWGTPQP